MSGVDGGPPGADARHGSPHARLRRGTTERVVLETLRAGASPLTRAELARRTSISPPAISDAVRRLEGAGAVTDVGRAAGRAGAEARLYEIAPAAGVVVGVEVGDGVVRAAVADLVGRVLEDEQHSPLWRDDTVPALAASVGDVLGDLARRYAATGRPVRAVAVAVAPPVDPAWPDGALAGVLSGEVASGIDPASVVLDDAVRFATRAERDQGAAAGADTFAFLHVGEGHGVGMGLMVGERMVGGAGGRAGRIGALPVGDGAGRARLGETLAACGLRADGDDRLPVPDVARAGRVLGEGVAAVCAVVDPDLVVVGGPAGSAPGLLAAVDASVAALSPGTVPVVATSVGDSAALLGALIEARARAWQSVLATRG